MKKGVLIGGLVALVIVGAGLVWLIVNKADTPPKSSNSSTTTDQVQSGTAAVDMQSTAFSPQTLKVKKGTKVTWTNKDSVMHNVVADDANNADGLPTSNDLFGKGGTYSFTFNTVGTITYFCTVHPFMKGTIEVVD